VDAADADPGLPFPEDAPAEGELVWLQPGHVDPTVNLHDALFLAEEDGSLERLPIDARRVTA
jgi:D-serine deaminase-like pyridoxal phosphate-dependent protein